MSDSTVADAMQPYLDYLDKEMTIQGILSAFCVAAAALVFDRILGADQVNASPLIKCLQGARFPFVIGAILGLILAALLFYLQRSDLAWLHGQISFAVTHEMQHLPIPTDTSTLADALTVGNSWSLWNCYKAGMSFLAVTAAELALALSPSKQLQSERWWIALIPFVGVIIFLAGLWLLMFNRDFRAPGAKKVGVNNLSTAKQHRRKKLSRRKKPAWSDPHRH